MARITRTITVDRPADEVFDAVADFATAQQWDPGVRASAPAAGPRIGRGAGFSLDVTLVGPVGLALTYRTTRYDRPRHVTHQVRTLFVRGVDAISVVEADGTTAVTWDARFEVRGPTGRLLEPVVQAGFDEVAERAVRGLESWLSAGGTGHRPR